MNEIYGSAISRMHEYTSQKDPKVDLLLYLFSVINKLERVGDLAKNIAEETIFYLEARILKHRKVKDLKKLL
jgi:phosphate transport system protein